MTLFVFDTDKIGDLGDNLDVAALNIDNDLVRLELELTRLAGSWSGEAQMAFERAQTEWTTSMRALERLVAAASDICSFAVEKYESTEESIEQKFA